MRNFFALFLVLTLSPSLMVGVIWGTLTPIVVWSVGCLVFLATPKPPKVSDMLTRRCTLQSRY